MGNRLSKIVTRTGDDGTTGLGDGSRIGKDSLRIQAIGEVDELNSHIGLLLCEPIPDEFHQKLQQVQHELFNLGAELSMPNRAVMTPENVGRMDCLIEESNASLPPLREFILPGGSRPAAQAHICRTVCRRAERTIIQLKKIENVSDNVRQYVNRLSDWLFVLARVLNQYAAKDEAYWENRREQVWK